MPLEIPNLDDRTFQQLVDEARRLIPQYSPTWTDHNLSDPGITLLELFATMVETLIYRLNRVPEKSYITFLNLMGVRLQPPAPAKVALTFWLSQALSGADSKPIPIPAGFEVAVQQTGTDQPPVSFMTDTVQKVYPLTPIAFVTGPGGDRTVFQTSGIFKSQTIPQGQPVGEYTFAQPTTAGEYLYIGVANNIRGHVVKLTLAGVETNLAGWQAWCGDKDGWQTVGLVALAKERPGEEVPAFQLPAAMADKLLLLPTVDTTTNGITAYWLRILATPISKLTVDTHGITVSATHATPISMEVIGRSNGQPRQTFRLAYTPVLPLVKDRCEVLAVQTEKGGEVLAAQCSGEGWEAWICVEDFAQSNAKDQHYTLDLASGEVAFGPLIREPDGTERQYGAIPTQGKVIRMHQYRSGGGTIGNVGAKTLTVMKGTLEGVDRVENRERATGGKDAETIERAALRAPDVLRTGERAVTAEDFERLSMAVPGGGIGRAYCIVGNEASRFEQLSGFATVELPPNMVRLLLVPAVEQVDTYISSQNFRLHQYQSEIVQQDLDKRRLLTARLLIGQPKYLEITVKADLKRRDKTSRDAVVKGAEKRLYQFLHPLTGGSDGKGWPFGRDLFISELYAKLQSVPGVDYVKELSFDTKEIIMPENENEAIKEGKGTKDMKTDIQTDWDTLIISGKHLITAA